MKGDVVTGAFANEPSLRGRAVVNRRTACGIVAGAVIGPLQGLLSPAFAGDVHHGRGDIRYVLTDGRYPESLAFAAAFRRRGIDRLEITDGLTGVWRNALVPLWRENGGAIAGLTRQETWMCVAEQARSTGRRSVLWVRHAFSAGGSLSGHRVSGSRTAVAAASALEICAHAWPAATADMILRCPPGDGLATASRHVPGPDRMAPADPSTVLVSWLIA